MEKKFNRAMLELARGNNGFSQTDLAKSAGVTQALVSKIENGITVDPTDETVAAFAHALSVPVAFFYSDDPVLGLPQYHYRKRARLGKKATLKIEAETNLRRMHIQRLFRSYETPNWSDFPSIDLDRMQWSPQQAAQNIRQLWMLPRGPIEDLTSTIERAGAIVIQVDFETSLMDAISFRIPQLPPLIFMNSTMPGDRYRFTLAHELAHMILHNQPCTDEDMEAQADQFASEFMMPAKEIRPHLVSPSLGKLARVKAYWKVSIKALIYRSFKLNLITPNQYTGLNVNYSKAGYSRGEPFQIDVEKPSTFANAIDYHLKNLRYSQQEISDLLLMLPSEFQRLYGLAGSVAPTLRVVK